MPFCPRCGTQVRSNAKFCHKCGHKLSNRVLTRVLTALGVGLLIVGIFWSAVYVSSLFLRFLNGLLYFVRRTLDWFGKKRYNV